MPWGRTCCIGTTQRMSSGPHLYSLPGPSFLPAGFILSFHIVPTWQLAPPHLHSLHSHPTEKKSYIFPVAPSQDLASLRLIRVMCQAWAYPAPTKTGIHQTHLTLILNPRVIKPRGLTTFLVMWSLATEDVRVFIINISWVLLCFGCFISFSPPTHL